VVVDLDVDLDLDLDFDRATKTRTRTRSRTRTKTKTRSKSRARFLALALLPLSCSLASPATEIREALAAAAPLELPAGSARITLSRAAFHDVEVSPEGGRARVLAVVDADGRVRLDDGREVVLGYVGREAFEMERCPRARWCPAGSPLPALAGVVAALAAAPRDGWRWPVAWQIRVERERATVGEDAEGFGGVKPRRGAYDLVRDGAAWRLAGPR
jgi:hypothetical protein